MFIFKMKITNVVHVSQVLKWDFLDVKMSLKCNIFGQF